MPELTPPPTGFTVRFANLDSQAVALAGESVLQCARRVGISLAGACGGLGGCGGCLIRIVSGQADVDQAGAPGESNPQWLRACRVRPKSDLVVEVSPRALAPAVQADLRGLEDDPACEFAPLIESRELSLDPAPQLPGSSDRQRLQDAMGEGLLAGADPEALHSLSGMLAANDWRLRAHLRTGELIGFTAPGRGALGLAIDLGTTNIAGSLVDLESGERLASLGMENPQTAFGADLITRINHAVQVRGGGRELQSAAVTAVHSLAAALCAQVSARPAEIADLALCGNTVMHHLLLGLPVAQLARPPFAAVSCDAVDIKARDLGLEVMSGAVLHLLPNIGGFVGGDHVAALLATEHLWESGSSVLIDIGTNTEISLIHDGAISTASTASGPALEGGNISCGMRAAAGAIEKVWLSEGEILTRVIGGGPPLGLCGSGVLDALSALRQAGIVDRRGYLRPGKPKVTTDGGLRTYGLAPEVGFTQDDVRAVQLAKAAIRAGLDLLLEAAGLEERMLDRVLIAGAFGGYLDLASAIAIGLFPALPAERFRQLGNAAGVGVRMALGSAALRARAALLAKRCRHLELNRLPGFQKTFIGRIAL